MNAEVLSNSKIGQIFIKIIAAVMESRFRYRFFSPLQILQGAEIHPGQTVLEVGCGTGFFTITAAQLIGDQGSLVAMDILPESIVTVSRKVQAANFKNVRVVKGDAMNTLIDTESMDAVLLFGILPAPMLPINRLLPEMHRILKPGGIMAVWPPSWVLQSISRSGLFTYSSKRNRYSISGGVKPDKEKQMDSPINLFKTSKGQTQYLAAYDAAMQLWPVPYESHFVTTTYGRTHIISCGQKDAFPLVLLHAGQASSTMWFPSIANLSKKFHLLALDTPGEPGKSTPSRRNDTRRDCSAWLEGVLDALDISKTHVMGLSRGGWLALNLALYAPNRLERIVLLSPAAIFIALNSFFSVIAQTVMRVPSRFISQVALNSWVARGFKVNEVFAEQFMTGLQNWDWTVNKKGFSGVMPCTFSDEELRQIHQNVLLLIGDQDRLNPPKALERARQTIPHLEAEIIPQAGHFLNMEQPESVNARILKFLAKG